MFNFFFIGKVKKKKSGHSSYFWHGIVSCYYQRLWFTAFSCYDECDHVQAKSKILYVREVSCLPPVQDNIAELFDFYVNNTTSTPLHSTNVKI